MGRDDSISSPSPPDIHNVNLYRSISLSTWWTGVLETSKKMYVVSFGSQQGQNYAKVVGGWVWGFTFRQVREPPESIGIPGVLCGWCLLLFFVLKNTFFFGSWIPIAHFDLCGGGGGGHFSVIVLTTHKSNWPPFFLVCSGGDALWWPMISNRFHSVAGWTLS